MAQHLGSQSFAILLALSDGERHGYDIMRQVALDSDHRLALGPATLYTSLKRLLDDGLLEEAGERADEEMGDARRKYYRLSNVGKNVLAEEADRAKKFAHLAHRRLA
jgi:DNA-binding PadR family transcriptional regulator